MNTFNTPATTIKAVLMSLISVGLFGGTAFADQVGPTSLTKTVRFDDLNLATAQGQEVAQERVQQMARRLCDQVADPTDMSHHANYLKCVDATVAKAGVSLQALINKQSTAQFARYDVK